MEFPWLARSIVMLMKLEKSMERALFKAWKIHMWPEEGIEIDFIVNRTLHCRLSLLNCDMRLLP